MKWNENGLPQQGKQQPAAADFDGVICNSRNIHVNKPPIASPLPVAAQMSRELSVEPPPAPRIGWWLDMSVSQSVVVSVNRASSDYSRMGS